MRFLLPFFVILAKMMTTPLFGNDDTHGKIHYKDNILITIVFSGLGPLPQIKCEHSSGVNRPDGDDQR